jgi:hypothetical protein
LPSVTFLGSEDKSTCLDGVAKGYRVSAQAATAKLAGQVFVAFHFLKFIFIYSGGIIFNTEISGFRKSNRSVMLVMESPINVPM